MSADKDELKFQGDYLYIQSRSRDVNGEWSVWKPSGMAPMPHSSVQGSDSLPVNVWLAYAAYLDARDYRGERYRVVRRSNYIQDEVL